MLIKGGTNKFLFRGAIMYPLPLIEFLGPIEGFYIVLLVPYQLSFFGEVKN